MYVGVIGREALLRGQPRAQREVRLDRRGVLFELERREQGAESAPWSAVASASSSSRARVAGRSSGRSSAARSCFSSALVALQREVQAPAPLAERRPWLREQPRDRVEPREVDAAARAAQPSPFAASG